MTPPSAGLPHAAWLPPPPAQSWLALKQWARRRAWGGGLAAVPQLVLPAPGALAATPPAPPCQAAGAQQEAGLLLMVCAVGYSHDRHTCTTLKTLPLLSRKSPPHPTTTVRPGSHTCTHSSSCHRSPHSIRPVYVWSIQHAQKVQATCITQRVAVPIKTAMAHPGHVHTYPIHPPLTMLQTRAPTIPVSSLQRGHLYAAADVALSPPPPLSCTRCDPPATKQLEHTCKM